MIVQLHWPMYVEVPFVHIMKLSLAINVIVRATADGRARLAGDPKRK